MKNTDFIINDKINIDKEAFKKIQEENGTEWFIDYLSDLIDGLPFPYENIELEKSRSDYLSLKQLDTHTLIKSENWFTRYEYNYSLSNTYISSCNVGKDASNYFFNPLRMDVDSINSPSAIRSWENKKFRRGFLKAIFTLKFDHVDENVLRNAIALRKYIPSQFRPSVAKAVYDYFGARKILDMSSGWGDRLISSTFFEEYLGFDPNTKLHPLYNEMINIHAKDFKAETICVGFENSKKHLKENYYDICFTSPPYFKIEKYSKEPSQSYLKYKKFEDWMNCFLFESIKNAVFSIKKGGILALNISDVYCDHKVNHICDSMNDYIKSLGLKYCGAIGMQMAKRPNSNGDKKGIFCEPIWVWEK